MKTVFSIYAIKAALILDDTELKSLEVLALWCSYDSEIDALKVIEKHLLDTQSNDVLTIIKEYRA